MKNNIIIFAAICCLLMACKGIKPITSSKVTSYKSLEEMRSDTSAYLKDNFVKGKSKYIGKTIEKLLEDINLQVKGCIPSDVSYKNSSNIVFTFFTSNEMDAKLTNKQIIPFSACCGTKLVFHARPDKCSCKKQGPI